MINQDVNVENNLLAQDEFLKLDRLLNRFNVFEATDMVRREIKHTKFLCYLLDPNESHGLGETFIRRFITLISSKQENFPEILDLDFSFARITAEFKVSKHSNNSLDCLIEIPLRGQSGKSIIIAIENKINSKQGERQLHTYSENLKGFEDDGLFKFYLVFNIDEEPKDESWKVITYSNVVLPVVEYTIEILEDKGALHLKETLNDYLVLLQEDEDGDKVKEQLANQLIQLEGVKKYLKSNDKNRKLFGSIYVKYKKVIDYLCQLDRDPRTESLNWWNELKFDKVKQEDLIFKSETSTRSYLRFSLLTENNRKNLALLADSSEKWLKSNCPIVFEIVLKMAYEKSEDKQLEKLPIGVTCSVTLVLGPLNDQVNRSEFFNALYSVLEVGNSKLKNEDFTGSFNRLIGARKLSGQGKSVIIAEPIKWIERNILTSTNEDIEFKPWIIEIGKDLNLKLDSYFKSSIANISK